MMNKEFFIKGHFTEKGSEVIACENGYNKLQDAVEFAKVYSTDKTYSHVTLRKQIFDSKGNVLRTVHLKTFVDGVAVSDLK